MTRTTLAAMAIALASIVSPSVASAKDGASVGFRLQATVQPFCRIQSELGDSPAVANNGIVELGMVREVCNTQGGYAISVQMLNVASGVLNHGAERQDLSSDGHVRIFSPQARSRTMGWRLTDVALRQTDAPVYMRVSISPL